MMKNTLASAEIAKARKPGSNRGELERIRIEPAANGYMVTQHFEAASSKQGYPEPERNVFTDHVEASKHVAQLLAKHAGAQPSEK